MHPLTYRCVRCALVNNALRAECKRCGHPANATYTVESPAAPAVERLADDAGMTPSASAVPLDVRVLIAVLYGFGIVGAFLACGFIAWGLEAVGVKKESAFFVGIVFGIPVSLFVMHHGLMRLEASLCGRKYQPRGAHPGSVVGRIVPGAGGLDAAFERMPLSDKVLFATVVLGVAGGSAMVWSPWMARHVPGDRVPMMLLAFPPIACGLAAGWVMRAIIGWMREGGVA